MFFYRKEKSKEQQVKEDKVMWIHENASYMTYIDEVNIGKKEIFIEGPHVRGGVKEGLELLALDCDGEQIGKLKIKSFESKKQGMLLGSVNTGEYLMITNDLIQGEKTEFRKASMLVNTDIFS
jgi:hypothetical protein